MFARRKFVSAAVALAAVVALSGCSGVFVEVVDPNGSGVCGSDAVSIDVDQNSGGDAVTIVYTGPSDVSLVAYQGVYSDSRLFGLMTTESYLFGYPALQDPSSGNPDVAINVLDATSEHWVITGSVRDDVVATYDGPVSAFVEELTYSESDFNVDGGDFDAVLPVTVGVVCGAGLVSGVSEGVTGVDGTLEGISLAAAQAFYPNFMFASAPTVTDQTGLANGVAGKMTLPSEIGDSLPDDFDPAQVGGSAVYIGVDDPMDPPTDDVPFTLDNAELGDIWFLTLFIGANSPDGGLSLEFANDVSLTEPNDFTLTTSSETDLPEEGYYLLTLFIADIEGDGDSGTLNDLRIVTSVMKFDGENGLSFETLNEATESEGLADTGGDPNVVIWAVLGGLVLLAAVALRPKGRKDQDGATIDPSARNE